MIPFSHFLRFPFFAALLTPLIGDDAATFDAYWRQGLGEITHYRLEQARYGELHAGEAVLIFVTEPFSLSKQVKLDDWAAAPESDRVEVLKLNFTKNFLTGLYPYSLMNSVFTPVDLARHPRTLKTTTSAQDWCGHAWLQLNFSSKKAGCHIAQFSYFEREADRRETLKADWIEDELWTRLRLAPDTLPTGKFMLLPGGFITRLLHLPLAATPATARWFDLPAERYPGTAARAYELNTPALRERVLTLHVENAFPHRILGWEEIYRDRGELLTTRASRVAELRTDYWTKQRNADRPQRSQLQLDPGTR